MQRFAGDRSSLGLLWSVDRMEMHQLRLVSHGQAASPERRKSSDDLSLRRNELR
jgi:hypothetical protein